MHSQDQSIEPPVHSTLLSEHP